MKHALDREIGYWEQYGNINLLLMELLPDKDVSTIIHAAEKGWDAVQALPKPHREIAYIAHRMLNG